MRKELEPSVRRALSSHFLYLDDLLARALSALDLGNEHPRAFYRYESDLSADQRAAIAQGIARVWTLLTEFSAQWSLDLPAPPMLCTHALKVDLQFMDIALDEMSPRTLSGYGKPGEDFLLAYRDLQAELRNEIRTMSRGLMLEDGSDT
ncbi:hypothetical protein Q8F57_045630 [Paraburkholderia terrae]|uniref:hypothetical protein n=1 Tax=Paraburkholderia terrae TaxID=311230 RepID=UPI00296B2A49|nr:hypothetical protein [Paraburkholderia terrae]MDW3660666.1 hypothetical protein [Paraburkholderia terrae]